MIRLVLFVVALLAGGLAVAQVVVMDKGQLVDALTSRSPCCVIDGRSSERRKQEPLADALAWRADLIIVPTATVVVLADRDQDALAIGRALEKKHPGKPVIVVKGGLPTWKSANLALMAAAGFDSASGAPLGFVIPSNTCEQGKPLQELRSDKR